MMTPAPISVERFDHDIGRQLLDPATETYRQVSVMNPSDSGEYVLYDDYAEREAEVASLRTDVETLVKMKQHQEDRAEAAERAREEARILIEDAGSALRVIIATAEAARWPITAEQMVPMNMARKEAGRIAAFLAASGGKADG